MLTEEEVKHIAKLARLGLTEKEVEKYQKDLSDILGYVEKLKEVNIEGVEPTSHSVLLENITRKDEALKFEKKLIEGHLKVKSVF
ncbi:MAG: Asp-tRNA(Asn)/Glu-tRNA(Gln) amidotransferase subunit GatC [Patescibacteria group bacterium]